MPSTYSEALRLELQATGENRSTWGIRLNTVINLIEDAVTGILSIAMSDANKTLTELDGNVDESRQASLVFTGTLTADRTITIPTTDKMYYIKNSTTGGFSLVVSNGTNTVTIPNGDMCFVHSDGTTILKSMDVTGRYFSAYGLTLVDDADAAAARATLGAVIGTNVQAYSANLDEYAAVNPTAAGLALLDDADAAAQRATLGTVIGTDVQAYSANLDEYAAVNPSADGLVLIAGDTDAQRTALGLANVPLFYVDVAALLADTTLTYGDVTAGQIIRTGTEGFSYEVAASGASDHHVTTGASDVVKLYVQPICGEYDVTAFGALGDDSTSNTTIIQTALNAATGKSLFFPAGIYQSQGLTPPANTTIRGIHRDISKIRVTGTNQNLFTFTNKSGLTILNMGLYGNSSAAGTGQGEAVRFLQTTAATDHQVGLHIENCHFENFKADSWVLCYSENTTYRMKKIRFIGNTIQSSSGNVLDGSTLGVMSTVIAVAGAIGGTSYVEDVYVANNIADGTYIKRFVDMWYGTTNAQIINNIIKDFGADASITDTGGAYAIMAYDSSFVNSPNGITVSGNTIDGVRACGIYMAGARDVHISDNIIRNQTDTSDASMPKGGICINACWDYVIANNALRDIACTGIRLNSAPVTGVKLDAKQNAVVTGNMVSRAKQGIRVHGITAASYPTGNEAQNFLIEGNSFTDFTSIGVEVQTFGANILDLTISNNKMFSTVAGTYGIRGVGFGGTPVVEVDRCVISGNDIETPYYGINWTRANTGSTVVKENTIHGPVLARGIDATYSTNIAFLRNTFDGFTSGAACFYTLGATGNLSETRFINCGTSYITVGATDMGRAIPTWTPTGRGEFVESLMLVETGTAPNKYVNRGWYYDGTAWREQRALTGA